jgi:hypothetical protein
MARFILDVETKNADEFVAVMQELKSILPNHKAIVSLISGANHFEENSKLNVLTDEEIKNFNEGICRINQCTQKMQRIT